MYIREQEQDEAVFILAVERDGTIAVHKNRFGTVGDGFCLKRGIKLLTKATREAVAPQKDTGPNYDEMDPGIREVVRWLRAAGFNTTDSGDGVSKPADSEGVLDMPHVHIMHKGDEKLPAEDLAGSLVRECVNAQIELFPCSQGIMEGKPHIQLLIDPLDLDTTSLTLYNVTSGMVPK